MKILVVDDEPNLRRMLRSLFEAEGHEVAEAESAEAGLELAEGDPPDVVLLDVILPGVTGLDALPRFIQTAPGVPVVMMSGEATLSDAARATREGAFHFLEKPLSPEGVLATVRGAGEVSRARDLSRALREELGAGRRLIGESESMRKVRETIRKVAPTDARVLIMGESGTGKELAATAIHDLSPRRGGPFVRVNSAAIPRDLVESEMFGHERGSFTGAERRRRGRFELAHKGTLFLDEIADLGEGAQAKLLRALESGMIQRVGAQSSVAVDVRVVAATNRDLHREVEKGRFREDLLFRLEVVPLRMPPLRERPDDLPHLVDHAVDRLLAGQGIQVPPITAEAMEVLTEHPWPGNVRELFNFMERLAILHPSEDIGPEKARELLSRRAGSGASGVDRAATTGSLRDRLNDFESELIREAIAEADGNVAAAARSLSTDRANLYRRMKRLGIRGSD